MVRPKRHSRHGYVSRGESTHNRPSAHKGALARGMARPGKTPTSVPPEVLCPRGTQGFGNLPKDRPGLGETTYTTSESSLCTNRVLLPKYPSMAGVPSNTGGSTSTLRYIGWPVETGRTIHSNAKQLLYTFPDTQITLYCSKTIYVHFRTSISNI